MEITEVRIKLMEGAQDRLLGFCSITLDRAFVVRDLKIIKGSKGAFVAMPSRKLTDRCPRCGNKNQLRALYCSQCGVQLGENRSLKSADGRAKLYADIAHPIHSECRDAIQQRVLQAFDEELILAQQPGYVCRYDDFGEYDTELEDQESWEEEPRRPVPEEKQRRWDQPEAEPLPPPHRSQSQPSRTNDEFGSGII